MEGGVGGHWGCGGWGGALGTWKGGQGGHMGHGGGGSGDMEGWGGIVGDMGATGMWGYGTKGCGGLWGGGGGLWLHRAMSPPPSPCCHRCPQGGGHVAPGLPHLGALQWTPAPSQRPPQLRQGGGGLWGGWGAWGGGSILHLGTPTGLPLSFGDPHCLGRPWVPSPFRRPHPTSVLPPMP